MGTVDEQIQSAADAISSNIAALGSDRALLAQNILSHLRNLAEGVAVFGPDGKLRLSNPASATLWKRMDSSTSFLDSTSCFRSVHLTTRWAVIHLSD